MSDTRRRVGRAVRDHGSFERRGEDTFVSVTTPFEASVDVDPEENGRARFDVTVRVPMLSQVVEEHVADVVEEGWFETFERRVEDVGGVTRGDHDLSPAVERRGGEAVVSVSFDEIDPRRGVDDAGALINFVEGTYAQGIIPGYEYTDPVTQLIDRARQTAGDDVSA
jgi:hypothetical protein